MRNYYARVSIPLRGSGVKGDRSTALLYATEVSIPLRGSGVKVGALVATPRLDAAVSIPLRGSGVKA